MEGEQPSKNRHFLFAEPFLLCLRLQKKRRQSFKPMKESAAHLKNKKIPCNLLCKGFLFEFGGWLRRRAPTPAPPFEKGGRKLGN
ncbi:MAG: hypothetical protein J6W28_05870 [Clostridia bacterium]|nr:hypothetical protein [Clostridia bacterium]